ncbi:hypothetical protein CLOLEP_03571 [[Clostridium] leptum DSM 753]|uniref:Uncharacterized protein n=1 Tax=[Clostridium] leptum DSM 753 TaxID=428125 RepID=A7VY94_9FIRM|nr:hypothetical protein CLOLEP_03571 [[Clostridium] leptum DSM 753]
MYRGARIFGRLRNEKRKSCGERGLRKGKARCGAAGGSREKPCENAEEEYAFGK